MGRKGARLASRGIGWGVLSFLSLFLLGSGRFRREDNETANLEGLQGYVGDILGELFLWSESGTVGADSAGKELVWCRVSGSEVAMGRLIGQGVIN